MQYSLFEIPIKSIGSGAKLSIPGQCLVVMAFIFAVAINCSPAQESTQEPASWKGQPVVVNLGRYAFVTNGQGEHIRGVISRASEAGASAIVLRINSPGGFASEARKLAELLVKAKVPVIAWVDGAASGAGAIAALSADKVYFSPDTVLGGEVEAIDWRGPAEDLPRRLTDLRYYDITDELVSLLAQKGRPKSLVKGICEPEEEVILDGVKFASSGDVLKLNARQAVRAGIEGGEVTGLKALLSEAGLPGDPVQVTAPEIRILRSEENGQAPVAAGVNLEDNESPPADVPEEDLKFGQTRLESYEGKIVVIPVEMESLMRETKFEFMKRVIKKADDDRASAIVFDLNTPGGIAWYTEEIMLADLQQITVPTYSYVNPKAMSAGALIAIATDRIYMHPPSTIGAAAPVMGGGQEIPETMLKKVMGDILSTADDVARRKGHNPDIAKAFIDTKIELSFELPVISSEGGLEQRDAFAPDTENDLLVLNSSQAVEIINGRRLFAQGTATSIEDLVAQEGLEGELVVAKPLGFEWVADWIVKLSPWLLLFGIAGAYMELKAPGFGIPGFTALICFGLFFFGHNVAGYIAGYESLGIFLLGIVLVIIEFFVFPGLLVFGLTGFALIFGSLIFAMVDPLELDWDGGFSLSGIGAVLSGPLMNLTIALIGAGVLVILLLRYLPSMPGFRRLILEADVGQGTGIGELPDSDSGDSAVAADGFFPEVGESGSAETDLRPSGKARLGSELLDVVSTGEFIEAGERVRIVERDGSRIVVERIS
jgi:membrane-bound serine protease (ClpP class)